MVVRISKIYPPPTPVKNVRVCDDNVGYSIGWVQLLEDSSSVRSRALVVDPLRLSLRFPRADSLAVDQSMEEGGSVIKLTAAAIEQESPTRFSPLWFSP